MEVHIYMYCICAKADDSTCIFFLISCFVGPLLTCKTSQGNKNTTVQRALVYGIEHKCLIYDMI